MKKFLTLLCAVMLVVMMVGSASAISYTSTFDVAGDFSLTGFSDPGTSTPPTQPTATTGPDYLDITNPTGPYSLDVPPRGTYDWYVEFDSLTLDFFGDNSPEFTHGHAGPVFVGTYDAPTPVLSGSYNFGNVGIPSYTDTTSNVTVGGYTLINVGVDWAMTVTPTTYDITQIALTITADNLGLLNADLTGLDNYLGGANRVIDGHATADFSVTAVPEPSTILLMGLGLLGIVGYSRKRSKKS